MRVVRAAVLVGVVAAAVAAAAWPSRAAASQLVDRDARGVSLQVNGRGVALISYRTREGTVRHVLVWGAVNAVPNPGVGGDQQRFRLDYSGGWKSQHNARYWQTFENVCRPYSGPQLPLFVAGCTAPDGSFWALQRWQRNLPMRGVSPWTAEQKAFELHVSHWRGGLPRLEIYQHWTYGDAQQGFFGRLVYDDQPVYGSRSASATVADSWARNIYIDSFNSDYGPGWKHDTAIATHPRNGGFCFTFVAQPPPKGYPNSKPHGSGLGERYRVTVSGPGVTPIIQWYGAKLTRFDASTQAQATQVFDQILAGDRHCAPER